MTLELFSTSVPAGLEPGRSGFCTVAMTRNMPRPLVEMLESLSAYRPVFLPTDPRAGDNPVTVSHLRVPVGGRTFNVVSRVCYAGQDYTSRSNRFAHHVVLEPNDPRPPGGPAWLAGRPGFLDAAFDGQVRWLPAGRPVPVGGPGPSACPTWQKATGDAGWAGVVAEALANPSGRSFFLIYDPGTDLLPLVQEALALLPPERRWEATFTTYFTGLPAGVGCTLRGVLRGSPEAASAPAGALLDLGKLAGKAPPLNEWTQAARAGKVLASANRFVSAPGPLAARAGLPPSPAQLCAPAAQAAAVASPRALARPDPLAFDESPPLRRAEERPRGVGKAVVLTLVASLFVLVGGVGTLLALRPDLLRRAHADKIDEDDQSHDLAKAGRPTDKDRAAAQTNKKFKPRKPALVFPGDAPVAGKPAQVRVEQLDFPPGAPSFPLDSLRFSVDDRELKATPRGGGNFEVTFDSAGKQKLRVEFPGDDRFDPFSADLSVKVLRLLPTFTVKARSATVKRGEAVEINLIGLPKEFTSLGLIRLADQERGELKPLALADGKPSISVPGLKAGKYAIKATFPGDGVYGPAESTNAAKVRVRRTVALDFKIPDRDEVSFGRLKIDVTVKGTDSGDPVPKGTLQLLSRTETLREGEIDGKGSVRLEKEAIEPGKYDLRLEFTPTDQEGWAKLEKPLPGPWQVVPAAKVKVSLEEVSPPGTTSQTYRDKVRFKLLEGKEEKLDALPRGKKYCLAFRPSKLPIKGKIEARFHLLGSIPRLEVVWHPSREAWGGKKAPDDDAPIPVVAFRISEATKEAPGAVNYSLENFIQKDDRAYVPLVPAFREVVASLHGSFVEVYEGGPDRMVVITRGEKKVKKKTRDKVGGLPLLRLKILDER